MKETKRSRIKEPLNSTTKNIDLVKKNPETWRIIPGSIGQYTYMLNGTKLSGVFNGHGLPPDTAYDLVSYKHGNDVIILGMGVVNARGDLRITNDPIDVGPAHEWTGDYTGQPAGYKIWLVPVANIENGKLAWHPNSFLFEKNLAR
jgi:hypothetical protein